MKWISVEDKLPEKGQKVKFILHGYEFRGYYQGGGSFQGNQDHLTGEPSGTCTTLEAAKWMPLPKPPEET